MVVRLFIYLFYLNLLFVILALGLSEANAPYILYIFSLINDLNLCVVFGDLLAVVRNPVNITRSRLTLFKWAVTIYKHLNGGCHVYFVLKLVLMWRRCISSRAPRAAAFIELRRAALQQSLHIKQRQNAIYYLNTAIQWT